VELVEELGMPELTTEQIEASCSTAENAGKKHVLAKVSFKKVERLNMSVEAKGAKSTNLAVETDSKLSPHRKYSALGKLVHEAVKEALLAIENYLRKPT